MNFTHRASIHTSFSFVSQSAILDWLENKSNRLWSALKARWQAPVLTRKSKSTAFRTLLRSYLALRFFLPREAFQNWLFWSRYTERDYLRYKLIRGRYRLSFPFVFFFFLKDRRFTYKSHGLLVLIAKCKL